MGVRVDSRPISVLRAYALLEDPRSGGVAIFVGRVRAERSPGSRVTALRYESHQRMAIVALRGLEKDARLRFGARRVVLWHRVGVLPIGVASVLVGVAAPHRNEAFQACRYLIDRLKEEVPIWKTDLGRPVRPRRARHARPAGR